MHEEIGEQRLVGEVLQHPHLDHQGVDPLGADELLATTEGEELGPLDVELQQVDVVDAVGSGEGVESDAGHGDGPLGHDDRLGGEVGRVEPVGPGDVARQGETR